MKKFIYLAGPIAGQTEAQANDWRISVNSVLKYTGLVAVSPLRCEPPDPDGVYSLEANPSSPFHSARAIAEKNLIDVRTCDAMLAYLPNAASVGTLIELGWAYAYHKPIIVVTMDPKLTSHPIIKTCAGWVLEDLGSAVDVLLAIFGAYTGGKNV